MLKHFLKNVGRSKETLIKKCWSRKMLTRKMLATLPKMLTRKNVGKSFEKY
jgi:thermostable 8-oxoguanine DNA glycosylase